jgi:hypothetical protein
MKVHVVEVRPPGHLGRFQKLAAASSEPERHQLVDDPADADLVLFTDVHFDDWRRTHLRHDPWLRMYRDRTLVFDESDRPWLAWPGIYSSTPRTRFDLRWQRAWLYPAIEEERFLPMRDVEPTQLASFVGSPTHRCREPLFQLHDQRLHAERVTGFMFYDRSSVDFDERRNRFDQAVSQSRFVLCPRGHGTSSFRLQEVLAAGRVPVIISDDWVAPHGVDLSRCTIRWPQRDYAQLLDRLERLPDRQAYEMAENAAATFDTYFARRRSFARIVDLASDLLATMPHSHFPTHGWRDRHRAGLELRRTAGQLRTIARSRSEHE